jgi:phospholipid/cholesterol/gamma-HCH transport system substrate-binding protein
MLTRRVRIQLAAFAAIALISGSIIFFGYMRAPGEFLGIGRYDVTMRLTSVGDLYEDGNVTYRGVEVGKVTNVGLTKGGAEAVLQLRSDIPIPADVDAQVHSVSAVGEQYVDLVPRSGNGPSLSRGDVIPEDRTSIPPGINTLLEATNRGLDAIPRDNLKTVVDESYTAVGGLGPELSRFITGATTLASDARKNLDAITTLIDDSKPILDSQANTSDSIQAWASHLATVTTELKDNDPALAGLIQNGPQAADEVRQLFDRVSPTLPTVLANLVSVGEVAVAYRADIEALLVLLPSVTADLQGTTLAEKDSKEGHRGIYLSFNLNLNVPPPCTTGFFPNQQMRAAQYEDYPDRPPGSVYCRIPQDSNLTAVRGARNYPCETVPGKRAATVAECESDKVYVPLNDGYNWKGDPNGTLTGQGVPEFPPGEAPPPGVTQSVTLPSDDPAGATPDAAPPVPIAAANYDPATGNYIGPDGQMYTQANLAPGGEPTTWQQMLAPPKGN